MRDNKLYKRNNMFPTESKDVNISILIQLEDKDLVNTCLTNKDLHNLCKSDDFWYRKIRHMFPYLSSEVLNKYKGYRSWPQYYIEDLYKYQEVDPYKLLTDSIANRRYDGIIIALEKGADVHAHGGESIIFAAMNGYTDAVKALLQYGANVHAKNDWALRLASDKGHSESVKALLETGADIHANDDQALIWASGKGWTETVRVLLEAGANVHTEDDIALKLARLNDHPDTVKLLTQYM